MERMQHLYDSILKAFAATRIPVDIVACELWLVGTLLSVYLPYMSESPARIVFGVPMLLFIPGYALVAVLFPATRNDDGIERVALSFGLSLAIAPLIGYGLNYTPWGIRLTPIMICLSLLTIILCLAAQYRRTQLPPEERFTVSFGALYRALSDEYLPERELTSTDRALSLLLIAVIIAVVATTCFMFTVPKEGEAFTDFLILGADQKMADYPTHLHVGENSSLFIEISNHEYRTINYTIETYLMNLTLDETTNWSSVAAMDRLDQFSVLVSNNETRILPYSFVPENIGYNRIEFLLFNESVPDESVRGIGRINRSDRDLHLWVTIRPQQ